MEQWGQQPFHVRIVDDSGHDVEQGESGEIICKSDQIMIGYWNNPVETDTAIRDGWLYTGDIGRFDEDGYLCILDRKKDMIVVSGSNVYCSEVEEVLGLHPSILEVAVIGMPLPEEGEEVIAVIVLRDGAALTLEELNQFCQPYLADYKIPAQLQIVPSLARTSVGKLDKAGIRKQYETARKL